MAHTRARVYIRIWAFEREVISSLWSSDRWATGRRVGPPRPPVLHKPLRVALLSVSIIGKYFLRFMEQACHFFFSACLIHSCVTLWNKYVLHKTGPMQTCVVISHKRQQAGRWTSNNKGLSSVINHFEIDFMTYWHTN